MLESPLLQAMIIREYDFELLNLAETKVETVVSLWPKGDFMELRDYGLDASQFEGYRC
ncbi:hypothetical protein [Methylomonas rapida]|uniref:Uncharacterized protein n=1 Tax=Methylomonas rapida TaxID=2963939 RepID=A0ABY7GKC6_9GAMM|nr:hypothetical protein [Methylomonas rapida]WAR44959.1 hypothetical protein NM686_000170 [Methylomonas rapida]